MRSIESKEKTYHKEQLETSSSHSNRKMYCCDDFVLVFERSLKNKMKTWNICDVVARIRKEGDIDVYIILFGSGPIPFLKLVNTRTGKGCQIWQGNMGKYYENFSHLVSADEGDLLLSRLKVVISKESSTENLQYYILSWPEKKSYAILIGPKFSSKSDSLEYVDELVATAEAAVNAVVRRGVVDPQRIVVGGCANGAFIASTLLANAPQHFCCGITRSGVFNTSFCMKKLSKPLLMIHGEDTDVSQATGEHNALIDTWLDKHCVAVQGLSSSGKRKCPVG
ncbi:putative glutamyl endopeptidase, chloroplastic [Salvia divinorum]|uniref:Glutamyl endopeptidase, chloroplastic n=1 Tax=Salvia divinorum TaxID=28513 RepID=A0ABD1IPM9_SALDI